MTMNATFDNVAFQYDKNRGGKDRGLQFANTMSPFIDANKKVLDLGVGTGVVAGPLENQGYDIIGIDISSEMLKHAANRVQSLIWSDMNTLPFLDNYFGSVYSVWSMHLLDDIASSLNEIRRVLSDGGYLLNCSAANIVTSPPQDCAGKIMAKMQIALKGQRIWHDKPQDLEALCNEASFSFEQVINLPYTYKTSAAQMIQHIEDNGMLTLQLATPEQHRDIVQPALVELRKLPNPDEPIFRERIHQISVLRAV